MLVKGLEEIERSETKRHLDKVKEYTEKLLKKYNEIYENELDINYLNAIVESSYMHDIGKVGISENILYKEGPLNSEERAIIETHTTIGAEMMDEFKKKFNLNENFEITKNIVKYHHEKWDGSGYPEKLKGEEIPFEARIVSIVDIYDALTSKRCYKEPWTHQMALEYIENESGKSLDPKLVKVFKKIH